MVDVPGFGQFFCPVAVRFISDMVCSSSLPPPFSWTVRVTEQEKKEKKEKKHKKEKKSKDTKHKKEKKKKYRKHKKDLRD